MTQLSEKDQPLAQDTLTREAEQDNPDDPQQTGTGSSQSPGGADAPAQSAQDLAHDETSYPGPRNAGEAHSGPAQSDAAQAPTRPGDIPEAGDVDPDSTRSSDETGQDGDPDAPGKQTAHDWNG